MAALEALVAEDDSAGRGLLAELKADHGQVGLETVLAEIDKLTAVRQLGLPDGLFADASEKLISAWRARAARSWPSDLRDSPREVRLTLLAALCWIRQTEITDALVELLIALVHKVNARAERRVERELTDDLRRVRGKEGLLFRLADAALEHPDEQVRTALYPVVGENTLRDLVTEAKANERAFQARVRTRAARLVFEPLPADAAVAAGRVGISVQQHRLPPDHARPGAAATLPRHRRQNPLLRRRGGGADRRGGAESLA
nr:hypothetical protein [Actinopolyspora halophila]